jgi:tRNA/rRNA methyltransferase
LPTSTSSYATTARERDGFKEVRGPVEAGRIAAAAAPQVRSSKTGITVRARAFRSLQRGSERLPTRSSPSRSIRRFASLNIAQAVLLMSYEWMKSGLGRRDPDGNFSGPEMTPGDQGRCCTACLNHLESALEARGYFRPATKKPKMVDNLRSVLTRAGFFSEAELKVLRGVVASLDYFSPQASRAARVIPNARPGG